MYMASTFQMPKLTSEVQFHHQTNRASSNRASQAINTLLGTVIGILNELRATSNSGTLVHIRETHSHALHGLLRILRLDTGDIPTGESLILRVAKIPLPPSRAVASHLVGWDLVPGSSSEAALGVFIDSNIDNFVGGDFESQRRVAVPAGHLVVGSDLVPEHDRPGLCVLILRSMNLSDVFVFGSCGSVFHGDNIAAPRITHVAHVADSVAMSLGSFSEAISRELAVRRNVVPACGGLNLVLARAVVRGPRRSTVSMAVGATVRSIVRSVVRSIVRSIVRSVVRSVVRSRKVGRTNVQAKRRSQRTNSHSTIDVDEATLVDMVIEFTARDVIAMAVTVVVTLGTGECGRGREGEDEDLGELETHCHLRTCFEMFECKLR